MKAISPIWMTIPLFIDHVIEDFQVKELSRTIISLLKVHNDLFSKRNDEWNEKKIFVDELEAVLFEF